MCPGGVLWHRPEPCRLSYMGSVRFRGVKPRAVLRLLYQVDWLIKNRRLKMFINTDVISAYTRGQALEDGVLVDVSQLAHEMGYRVPVAITEGLHQVLTTTNELEVEGQSYTGRLWDVLWCAKLSMRRGGWTDSMWFKTLIVRTPGQDPEPVKLWAKAGPGDNMELVITIILEGED